MSPPSPTLGSRLREAREARGLSTSQLAELTRIKIQQIEGLEQDDFSRIPAPMYARGFIKILAQELALDARELIALYESQTVVEPPPPPVRAHAKRPLIRPAPVQVEAPKEEAPASSPIPEAPPPPSRRFSPPPRPAPRPSFHLPPVLKDRRVQLILAGGVAVLVILLALGRWRTKTSTESALPELAHPLLSEPAPVYFDLPRTLP